MAQERRDGPDPYKHPPSMLRRDSGGSWRAWRGSGGDVARLDAIRDLMAQNGVRLSTSQAVKVALRTAPLDAAAMRQALDAIRSEDGRKW